MNTKTYGRIVVDQTYELIMKVIGIIAEFNPFHNGHQYLIETAKQQTGADYAVVVMSPDFVQRGSYAMLDKYTRTKMALLGGADVVLELPVCCAAASAEYFATAGVRILRSIGVVTHLCFGLEGVISPACCPSDKMIFHQVDPISWSDPFTNPIISILTSEPPAYKEALQSALRAGISFPAAREKALAQVLLQEKLPSRNKKDYLWPKLLANFRDDEELGKVLHSFLSSPNNILALEYLRAIQSTHASLIPVGILRQGQGYHGSELPSDSIYASASAIRSAFETRVSEQIGSLLSDKPMTSCLHWVHPFIPSVSFEAFAITLKAAGLPDPSRFDSLMHYALLMDPDPSRWFDVSKDLSDRMWHLLPEYAGFESFAMLCKSKNVTLAHVRRALLHVFLQIPAEHPTAFRDDDAICHSRILGFRKEASPLLHAMQKNTDIPIITKPGTAKALLSPAANEIFTETIRSSMIYQSLRKTAALHEYRRSPVIVSETDR